MAGVEVEVGVFLGADLAIKLSGSATADPNAESVEGELKLAVEGAATATLKAVASIDRWYFSGETGISVQGKFATSLSQSVVVNSSGISAENAKLTYGISMTGKIWVTDEDGDEHNITATFEPAVLQGESEFSINFPFS